MGICVRLAPLTGLNGVGSLGVGFSPASKSSIFICNVLITAEYGKSDNALVCGSTPNSTPPIAPVGSDILENRLFGPLAHATFKACSWGCRSLIVYSRKSFHGKVNSPSAERFMSGVDGSKSF